MIARKRNRDRITDREVYRVWWRPRKIETKNNEKQAPAYNMELYAKVY